MIATAGGNVLTRCTRIDSFDSFVTSACGSRESGFIEDCDVAPTVTDELALLQNAGGLSDADPSDAQHMRKKFVGEAKVV